MKTCSVRSKHCDQYQSEKYYHKANNELKPIIPNVIRARVISIDCHLFWGYMKFGIRHDF